MLDNNTNKVVWIGVAVGVVGLLGTSAILLFPAITDEFKPMIRNSALVTQATPEALRFSENKTLTYEDNYNDIHNTYYFYLAKKTIEIPAGSYVYYGVDVTPNKDATLNIDISNANAKSDYDWQKNDWDDVNWRQTDVSENGELVKSGVDLRNPVSLKANHTYHISIKYRNTNDFSIYDSPVNNSGMTTSLMFAPVNGVKIGNNINILSKNYKVNVVHF